jgi:Kelch motif
MSGFAQALNKIVTGREETPEEIEANAAKKARRDSEDDAAGSTSHLTVPKKDYSNSKKFLIIRGFVAHYFDPQTGEWERCTDARRDRSYFETVLHNDSVYAISTYNLLAAGTVERFVLSKNQWEIVAPLPKKIRSVAAAVVPVKGSKSGQIYVTGGIDLATMAATDEVYVLDASATTDVKDEKLPGRWDLLGNRMRSPRYRHAAVVFDNKLWVIGGIVKHDGVDQYTSTTEYMDIATGEWTKGPTMCGKRAIDVSPLVVNGVLYVVGGDMKGYVHQDNACDRQSSERGTIERYDPATHAWHIVTSFPHERRGFSAAALPNDTKIYTFGGRNGDEDLTTFDAFDVVSGKWDSKEGKLIGGGSMPTDCLWGRAIALQNA